MILFILLKSERSHHGKITKNIQIYTNIAILTKQSEFCRRPKYMYSPNPIFKLIGFILSVFKGGSNWLFRYVITASMHADFWMRSHESASQSIDYEHMSSIVGE